MIDFRPHIIQIKGYIGKAERNSDGYLIPAENEWSKPIPCRYETDGKDNIVTNPDGSFTTYPYVVWLDKTAENYEHKFVRLIGADGEVVEEERQVQKQIPMQLRTKLLL